MENKEVEWKKLANTIPQIIWTAKGDGQIDFYNDTWYNLTGASRDDFSSEGWHKFVSDMGKIKVDTIWGNAMEKLIPFELELMIKVHGIFRWFIVKAVPLIEDGKLVQWVGSSTDIDDYKKALESATRSENEKLVAIQSNKMKSQFIANISHELRTPLHGILGMTCFLSDTELTLEQATFVASIKKSTEYLTLTVNDLLDLTRLEAGKVELEKISFDLIQLFRETLASLLPLYKSKNLDFSFQTQVEKAYCFGDPHRIRQVIINVVGNSIKFTETGKIVISLSIHENSVVVRVLDTGIGISSHLLERLFEPFSQEDATSTRRFGGSGLGLYISKYILKTMLGDIKVVSTGATGTCFEFTFIIEKEVQELGTFKSTLKTDLVGKRVLVVEDNSTNQMIAKRSLEKAGAVVECADNGQEGVDKCRLGKFDLVLMDLQMPIMDGFNATKKIRESGNKVPIIAMTASAMKSDMDACLEAGMNDHLSKPTPISLLVAKVFEWTE